MSGAGECRDAYDSILDNQPSEQEVTPEQVERIDCPACFGTEDDCDSCNGRGYFLRFKKEAKR